MLTVRALLRSPPFRAGLPSPLCPHRQHLVPAALELVGDLFDLRLPAAAAQRVDDRLDVRGGAAAQVEEGEDADLAGDVEHALDRLDVERQVEVIRVEKQQVGAEAQVELAAA